VILSEANLREAIRMILEEVEEEPSSVDVDDANQDANKDVPDQLIVSDPKNPLQQIILTVQDNEVILAVKDKLNKITKIEVTSDEWHKGMSAIVSATLHGRKRKAIKLLRNYLARLYPEAKEGFVLRRYATLAKLTK
tara:strand:- start:61 stop:471 length:411 start_codon:yes stop_codon:yes gene_type:complete